MTDIDMDHSLGLIEFNCKSFSPHPYISAAARAPEMHISISISWIYNWIPPGRTRAHLSITSWLVTSLSGLQHTGVGLRLSDTNGINSNQIITRIIMSNCTYLVDFIIQNPPACWDSSIRVLSYGHVAIGHEGHRQ